MVGLSLGVAVMGAVVSAQWPGDLAQSAVDATAFTTGIARGFIVNAVLAIVAAAFAFVTIRTKAEPHPPINRISRNRRVIR
jgi:hypothetical protein